MSEKRTRFSYGYVVTAAGFTILLVGGGTYTPSFGVFLKPIVEEFGWTRGQASLGYSLSVFMMGILSIGMGWLTDKLGPRFVEMVLGSFLGICYILMSQVTALWQFQFNYAFFGAIGSSTIFDHFGIYRAVFWMGIVISLVGALLVERLKPMIREKGKHFLPD